MSKRFFTVLIAAALVLSFTGCSGKSDSSVPGASTGVSSGVQSGVQSGVSSGAQSQTTQQEKKQEQKKLGNGDYSYKDVSFGFNKNFKQYHATYQQLSANVPNSGKINDLIKQTALQTINSYGTEKGSSAILVSEKTSAPYHGSDLLSLMFKETVETMPLNGSTPDKTKDKITTSVRTLNIDLKTGEVLNTQDVVQNNSALMKALEGAAKKISKKKVAQGLTPAVIQSGLAKCSIYFKTDEIEFSLPVPESLGGHVELEVKYGDTDGFRTNSTVWQNFAAQMSSSKKA